MDTDDNRLKEDELKPHLENLMWLTKRLRFASSRILLLLLLSLIGLGVFTALRKVFFKTALGLSFNFELINLFMLVVIFMTSLMAISLLIRFSALRNKGMIIYEEITDEMDWGKNRETFLGRPPLETRIVIKEFLKATDLPFTSGVNGQAFYIILFILISIISVVLISI